MRPPPLPEIVDRLTAEYGSPKPPPADAWELILRENVAYLADDARREEAFRTLRRDVGTRPKDILAAPRAALVRIGRFGILPEKSADKLRTCARIAEEEFGGNLKSILKLPVARAKRALKKFPGIGAPGAEKILLFAGVDPVLALDSNGLRTLVRLGFGPERAGYAATYRAVREKARGSHPQDGEWMIAAHQLLRRHGQETCRRSDPLCGRCPLARGCAYDRTRAREAPTRG